MTRPHDGRPTANGQEVFPELVQFELSLLGQGIGQVGNENEREGAEENAQHGQGGPHSEAVE